MQRDPVDICRNTLVNWGVLTRARADEIEAAAKKETIDAFAWADQQPLCKPEDGLKNVFVEGVLVQCAALFCTYPTAVTKAALARVTLAKMSLALAVQMNGLGSML